jgi:hypothetical protein
MIIRPLGEKMPIINNPELGALTPKPDIITGQLRSGQAIDTTRHFFLYFFPKSMAIHQGFV